MDNHTSTIVRVVHHRRLSGAQEMAELPRGRPLAAAEAQEVTGMARRIAAILLLEPALDASYARVKAGVYPWPVGA